MKKTISVPNMDGDNLDSSYRVVVDYDEAIRLGADKIGAAKVGRHYYYRADEVDEVFRLTPMEVAQLGAGELDERGSDYSLWCSVTGKIIKHPRTAVRDALGIAEKLEKNGSPPSDSIEIKCARRCSRGNSVRPCKRTPTDCGSAGANSRPHSGWCPAKKTQDTYDLPRNATAERESSLERQNRR